MNFPLPEDVLDIIAVYEKNGYSAHIVGGPVRDYLLGIPPHDFDITTDATPEETKALFAGERIIETGIQHGTVTLLKSSVPYEITTYRIDGEYHDGRHPEGVTFTRLLAEDLARRDFTVNAMAYTPRTGVVDLFFGKEDVKNRILRAVGEPKKRFEEDALRILRALRFRSRLGFEIEENTKKSIFEQAHLMTALATERILSEFRGILCGRYAEDILAEYSVPLAVVLPELSEAFTIAPLPRPSSQCLPMKGSRESGEVYLENTECSDMTCEELFLVRLLALADRAGLTTQKYSLMCERLHTSRYLRDDGARILSVLDTEVQCDYDLLHLLSKLEEHSSRLALELLIFKGQATDAHRFRLEELLQKGIPYRISDLALRGTELLALGYRGPEVGEALAKLLEATMRGEVKNEKEVLLQYLKQK